MIDIKTIIAELEDMFKIKFKQTMSSMVCDTYASYKSKKKVEYSWFIHKYSIEIFVSYYVDIIKNDMTLSCSQMITDESHLYSFFNKVDDVNSFAKAYL